MFLEDAYLSKIFILFYKNSTLEKRVGSFHKQCFTLGGKRGKDGIIFSFFSAQNVTGFVWVNAEVAC